MRRIVLVSLAILWSSVCMATTIHVPSEQPTIQQLDMMPLAFTENQGQWDERVKFRANAGGATLWVSPPLTTSGVLRSVQMPSGATTDDLGVPSGITNCSGMPPAIGCGNNYYFDFDWEGGEPVVWSVSIAPTPCHLPTIDGLGQLNWLTDCWEGCNDCDTFRLWHVPESDYYEYFPHGFYSLTVKAVGPMLTDWCNFDAGPTLASFCAYSEVAQECPTPAKSIGRCLGHLPYNTMGQTRTSAAHIQS